MTHGESIESLLEQKLEHLREYQELTQQGLLLVDLDDLDEILERKATLIGQMQELDTALAGHLPPGDAAAGTLSPRAEGLLQEVREVIASSLENDQALEERMREEQAHVNQELREIGEESRLRRYLERQQRVGGKIDVKH